MLRHAGALMCVCLLVLLSPFVLAEEVPSDSAAAAKTVSDKKGAPRQESLDDASLEAVVETTRKVLRDAQLRMEKREAVFAARKEKARQRLLDAQARMRSLEERSAILEARFESNRVELDDKAQLLKDKLGALKELFGVFQQNASDLIGAFNGSPTSIQYPNRDEWLEGFANRMKNASEVSSVDDIMGLWFEMQREITATGDIVSLQAPVVTTDGEASEREVVRIGGFNLISHDPQPAYLLWSGAGQEIVEMPRQPAAEDLAKIDAYLAAEGGLHPVSVDPTGGVLVSLLVQKPTLIERIHQGGLVGYIILVLGGLALLLAAYKLFDIAQISLRVQAQERDLHNPRDSNVLGQLLLVYAGNRNVDIETLEMRLHEAVEKASLRVHRFTIFLGIIAAVAPLLGLLGTVVGMINTFQAITLFGTGDPQTMAGGISQALVTTVLGLTVAVPAVLLHAVVSGRGKTVVNLLRRYSAALTGDEMQNQQGGAGAAMPPRDFAPQPA